MFKKPEDITPLPAGYMDAFTKTVNTQLGNFDVAQEASAPEAPSVEAAIPEQKLEESTVSEDNTNDKSDDGEGLDKADPKAAKKKFKDRKDKDIDNDGDSDDSDEYLHKRRKAIAKAIAKKDVEDIQEIIGTHRIPSAGSDSAGIRHDSTKDKTPSAGEDQREKTGYNTLLRLRNKLNLAIHKAYNANDEEEEERFEGIVDRIRDEIRKNERFYKDSTAKKASADAKRYDEQVDNVSEAKFGDNDLVHIAKANVRGNNNPKTDKIIGYSKAPKNPNKFPDPKSGANAIMRIADAKKKGFKVESADLGKPEGFFSEEMNPTDHVRFDKETNMFCVYNRDGKKVYESEKEEEANKYAIKNHKSLMGESVQLDEVRGKLNAKGEIEMTKANFAKVHKDFKTKIKGQPFAMQIDPKTGGSALFPVKFIKEAVALDEKYQQFTDKTPNWGEDQALTYGRKKGYKEVAVMGDGKGVHAMVLFALNSEDKKFVKGANVKSGETVFRYTTKISIAGDIFPLVKVNIAKGIFYPLTQESSDGSIEKAKFETRGVKLKFFRTLEGAKLESLGSEDETKVKEIIGKLKGASKAHAGQAKDLEKALNEAPITGIQGKDNKKYSIELDKSGRKVMVRTKNQFGDIKTISLKQAAKLFEASDLEEKKIDPADMDDMKATKGDKESVKLNIIVQLRKAADVKGNLDIVFADGKKQKLPVNIIKIALDKYNSFRKPATKKKLVDGMSKSYRSMLQTLKTIKEYSEESESKES
ncbi:hypothetical protein N9H77_02620 [Porticoccaceae bacterium]|nr:hypothetical protein [Porticoccaceae bacterium]